MCCRSFPAEQLTPHAQRCFDQPVASYASSLQRAKSDLSAHMRAVQAAPKLTAPASATRVLPPSLLLHRRSSSHDDIDVLVKHAYVVLHAGSCSSKPDAVVNAWSAHRCAALPAGELVRSCRAHLALVIPAACKHDKSKQGEGAVIDITSDEEQQVKKEQDASDDASLLSAADNPTDCADADTLTLRKRHLLAAGIQLS